MAYSITCYICFLVFKCLCLFDRQKKSDPISPFSALLLPEALIDRFTSDVPFALIKYAYTYRLIKFGLLTQSIMWFPTFGFRPACPSGLNSIHEWSRLSIYHNRKILSRFFQKNLADFPCNFSLLTVHAVLLSYSPHGSFFLQSTRFFFSCNDSLFILYSKRYFNHSIYSGGIHDFILQQYFKSFRYK